MTNRIQVLLAAAGVALAATAQAQPSSSLSDYVLFSSTRLAAKGLDLPAGGDVGVNDAGGRLKATRGFDAPSSTFAADRMRVAKDSDNITAAEIFVNVVQHGAVLPNFFTTPIIPNVGTACGFPVPFPACDPSNDVVVVGGSTTQLPPGTYGDVRVKGLRVNGVPVASVLELLGGTYRFCSMKVGRASEVLVRAPSTVNVAGRITLSNDAFAGPAPGFGVVPSDIQVYATRNVKFSRATVVQAHVCAPDATLRLKEGGDYQGQFVAKSIRTARITLVPGSPSGAFLDGPTS